MISFKLPTSLNGAQIVKELNAAGVVVNSICQVRDDLLWLDIADKDKSKAQTVVNSHVGINTEPSVIEKLEQIGLNLDELKAALLLQ